METTTTYMGLKLANPVVASSSPLGAELSSVRALAEAGAAAIVLPSLFEEQIEHEAQELDYFLHYGAERFAESITFYPEVGEYQLEAQPYLDHLRDAVQAVDVPVIASLNGVSAGGWVEYAQKMQAAGAAGIELNVYFLPTNPRIDGAAIEEVYVDILRAVKQQVSVPVAVKLSPYLSATASMAMKLDQAGADALVLFNRFYQPDIDLDALEVQPSLKLSTSDESRLPLRWMAILYGQVGASMAATTGVHTGADAAKMILAGADVTMMASSLLANGPKHVATVLDGLREFMQAKGYESLEQMRGVMSLKSCPEPAAFERANYMKTLQSYQATGTFE